MGRNARRREAAKLIEAWHRRTEHPPRPQRRYVNEAGAVVNRAERRRVRYSPAKQDAPLQRKGWLRGILDNLGGLRHAA